MDFKIILSLRSALSRRMITLTFCNRVKEMGPPQNDLLELNRKGLIPGPEETEQEYFRRAEYCLHLKATLKDQLEERLPFLGENSDSVQTLKEAFPLTLHYYNIEPEWVPLFFSDHKLSLWQGGCTWVFQTEEQSPKAALIQLRQQFRITKRYLGLYSREELLAHELAHVGRLAFEEPKFEEFFAYKSSPSRFRRIFGPVVKTSYESLTFVALLCLIILLDVALLALGWFDLYRYAMWAKAIPLLILTAGFARLWIRHRQLAGCFNKVAPFSHDAQAANAILYRLTDREITAFNHMSHCEVREYMENERALRWKVIKEAYLREDWHM